MQTAPELYQWTYEEYMHLAETGFFEGKLVELIEGQIRTMSPKGPRHEGVAEFVRAALTAAFASRNSYVRKEAPLILNSLNAPEPDAAVVVGGAGDYLIAHPTPDQVLLIVEVADSSRVVDLGLKARLYAAAGIDDYWVVCPAEGEVIVLRERVQQGAAPGVWQYAARRTYRSPMTIQPLAPGALPVSVADLLP
jgi:Uma2 family endonuclease